jgi:two-component system CheB/CheR fusion protein
VLLDREGQVVMANPKARAMFQLAPEDVGRPFQDLELSYRPVELRSLIEQAQSLRQPVALKDVPWPGLSGDGTRFVDVLITGLHDREGDSLGVKISFSDVSRYKRLQEELQHSHQELETAYEELQSTNEEKETANEELQSTVEELETTNEELQSTNEELETMNEELQSTNEELQATNEELSQRSDQLNQAAAFLQSIMASLRSALIVVDKDLSIKAWSPQAAELWGLSAAEVVEKNLLGLDIGLPADSVRQLLKSVLAKEPQNAEVVVDAVNRRGKAIRCRLICTPLAGPDHDVRGAIFLMEEATRVP